MVQQAATESLKKHLRGQLLCQDDPGYNEARKIWNGMIDKRPALVARCSGAGDVVNSIKAALPLQGLRLVTAEMRLGENSFLRQSGSSALLSLT